MKKKNLDSLRHGCIVFMAAFSLSVPAQSTRQIQPYSFQQKGVFYGRQPVIGIDMSTFVDPLTFRLRIPGGIYPDTYPSYPDEGYNPYYQEGYMVTSNAVLFNGKKISDNPRSFRDLGWGYGKDNFEVYYMGRKIEGAMNSSFKVLKDGYAEDSFETYYRGKVVK